MATYILFSFILTYILVSISKEDMKTMLISENKLRIFAISGVFYLIYLGSSNDKINVIELILNNSFSMLIVFLLMYSVHYVSYKLFRVNSLGMGDIKLSTISTLWLGIEFNFISLCISFLISAIYSLHGKYLKGLKHLINIHLRHFYQLEYFVLGF